MPLTNDRRVSGSGSFDQIAASAARTTSGSTAMIHTYGPITGIVLQVNVTAVSGTSPTLTVKAEDSVDGTNWNAVAGAATSSITATGITLVRVDLRAVPVTERLRFTWTIGGTTPSFTFAVDAYTLRA